MQELHLRGVFRGVQFVNTILREERSNILQTEEQSSSLPEDSTDVFKRNNIDRYIARPSVSFCDEKYSILDSFSFAEFTAYCRLIYKPEETNKGEEYQPGLLPESFMEVNHENLNYAKIIKLMDSNEKMQCQKVCRVLRHHTPNKYRFPEKDAQHLLFPFFSVSIRKRASGRTFVHIPEKVS